MGALKPKILIVDDEPAILRIIQDLLENEFNVISAKSGEEAVHEAIDKRPDLILLDNLMPGMSGVDAARFIRKGSTTKHIPIVMLTALKEPLDRVDAFKAGVDDFISKPFHPDDLLARIASKLERFKQVFHSPEVSHDHTLGNLRINLKQQLVEIDGKRIPLTHLELNVLGVLLEHVDEIVDRKSLIKALWSSPDQDERILDVHIATLRKKIKKFNRKIETVYRKGYIIRSRPK
jgi:two-component system phosphate regulon response regulator PhoB